MGSLVTPDAAKSRIFDTAFTEKDANIILQSSNAVFYRISSFTLRTTSGFFRGMMTLPRPHGISPTHNGDDDIITLDENSAVLGRLLRMISGFEVPKWGSFDEVENLLAAAHKYDMPGPLAIARTAFMWPFATEQPLRLYAVAARYGWEEEAKLASNRSLDLSIHGKKYPSVLERVPSAWLLPLFRLHRERREVFRQRIIEANEDPFGIDECPEEVVRTPFRRGDAEQWMNLARLMVWEIDRHPAGGVLLSGEWMQWPEAKSCLRNIRCKECGQEHDYSVAIGSLVTKTLQELPSTI